MPPLFATLRTPAISGGLALLLLLYVSVQMFTFEPAKEAPDFASPSSEPVRASAVAKGADKPVAGIESSPREVPPVKVTPPGGETEMRTSSGPLETVPAIEPPTMDSGPAAPEPATPKTHVTVTKPVDVKLRFGTAKVLAGTEFKIISRDAANVTVVHGAETVTIPIEATDLAVPLPTQ